MLSISNVRRICARVDQRNARLARKQISPEAQALTRAYLLGCQSSTLDNLLAPYRAW